MSLKSLSELRPESLSASVEKKPRAPERTGQKETLMLDLTQTTANGNGRPWANGSTRNPDQPARTNDPMAMVKALVGTTGFVRLTAEQAATILRECRYERQNRDLLPGGEVQIDVLCDMMLRNQWRAKDKLDFALIDGRLIIMNGHHRLGAQAQSGKKIEWVVVVHKCATAEEVAALYYTFDTNVRARTKEQILSVVNLHEVMEISKTLATALWTAVPLLAANFDFKKSAKDPLITRILDLRLEWALSFKDPVQAWAAAIEPSSKTLRRRLCTQGAVAVAVTTFLHRKHKAAEFWSAIANNDGLAKGTPEHTYVNTVFNLSQGTASASARTAATAWNAFYEGRRLSFIRISEDTPIRISGTPIGG